MKINILTIFPDMFDAWQKEGMVKKAIDNNVIEINVIDFRQYSNNKHNKVDEYPFGGKEGMLLMAQPIFDAIQKNNLDKTHLIFPSPKGKTLNQKKMIELSKYKEITLLAGRYEGVDQRVIDTFVDEQISLGDFIITGGELAISVILDGVIRLLPNVLNNSDSHINDSFTDDLLEQPQYTRPFDFRGLKAPEILVSGHHKNIDTWINEQKLIQTYISRPDLLKRKDLSKADKEFIKKYSKENK